MCKLSKLIAGQFLDVVQSSFGNVLKTDAMVGKELWLHDLDSLRGQINEACKKFEYVNIPQSVHQLKHVKGFLLKRRQDFNQTYGMGFFSTHLPESCHYQDR